MSIKAKTHIPQRGARHDTTPGGHLKLEVEGEQMDKITLSFVGLHGKTCCFDRHFDLGVCYIYYCSVFS